MHILVTRPEPDAAEQRAQLEARGHQVSLEPLLSIEPVAIASKSFEGAQALIATSRNGLHALAAGDALTAARRLPVFTVGPGTAALARELGFERVIAGAGTARDLVPHILAAADPAKGPLVHVAGEVQAFDIAGALREHGFSVAGLLAYRAKPAAALSPQTVRGLAEGAFDAIILMSPRSADIFAQLVAAGGLGAAARRPAFLCLSEAVADALQGLAPARIEIAAKPNAAAMLAAVDRVASGCRGV